MKYSITLTPRAAKDVEGLVQKARKSVYAALTLLEDHPRPPSAKSLKRDLAGNYRMRVGDYCISYSMDDQARMVTV